MKNIFLKNILLFIIVTTLCTVMCSCGQPIINTPQDEVKLYSWLYEGEYGITSTITFENDSAALKINRDDESCIISGLCIFNDNNFIIIDESLKKTFAFEYTLYGDKITVKYGESSVDFSKVND